MTVVNKLALVIAAVLPLVAAEATAQAQSLEERIAAVKRQRARSQQARELRPNAKILQTLLYEPVTVDFQEVRARDAFDFLKTVLDINMVVRWADDPVGHGIDPETLITLDLSELAAIEVLDLMLEQCQTLDECTWQLRPGFLEVGTKERLASSGARVTRVYPVDDLIYRAPRFDDAPPNGIIAPWDGYYPAPYFNGALAGAGGGTSGSFGGGTSYPNSGNGRGGIYDRPTDINSDAERQRRGEALADFVVDTIEPMAWAQNGGEWATIEFMNGSLVVNAPDFIQRQLGGYPRVPPPPKPRPTPTPATKPSR